MARRCLVAYEQSYNKEEALEKVLEKINEEAEGRVPILIVFFSSNVQFYYHASKLHEVFPQTTVIGSSSYICLSSEGYGPDGLVALAVFDGIDCSAGFIGDVTTYPMQHAHVVKEAAGKVAKYDDTICLEFTTALLNCEEIVLDTLRSGLKGTGINVIGSSSGMSASSIMTYVSLNGKVYNEGCVFVLIHNEIGRIKLIKENMYQPTIVTFTVTDVDCENRMIYEIDGRNAVQFLCEKLGVRKDRLKGYLDEHPLGRIIGDDISTISVAEVDLEGGALYCESRIFNRTRIALMEARPDLREVWNETKDRAGESGEFLPAFSIVANCAIRTDYFIEHRMIDEFNDAMTDNYRCYIGTSGMGEQFVDQHFNQTMVMALFE
ncbi:MAG: hypothetical protein K5888_09395 [Lachnospiraceae bacterium]|nr:hypothetical protein [Lachnospiraceae bacterium]